MNWKKHEREVAKSFGLKPVRFSGGGWESKEDGESDYVLAQLKSTEKKSISIKQQDIDDLVKHARQAHKLPVFIIDFIGKEPMVLIRAGDIEKIAKFLKWDVNASEAIND